MRGSVLKNNFTSGEITPLLDGRVELEAYQKGLETCLNMIPMRHGGVTRRPGTRYLGAVKDSSKTTRLIPFVYSDTDSLVIEMGDQYMRFWTNSGLVRSTSELVLNGTFDTDIANWTDASVIGSIAWSPYQQAMSFDCGPGTGDAVARQTVAVATSTDYKFRISRVANEGSGVDQVVLLKLSGTAYGLTDYLGVYLLENTDYEWTITTTSTSLYIEIEATNGDPTVSARSVIDNVSVQKSASGDILEVVTPYLESELDEVMYAQANDYMWFTHQNHEPKLLKRTSATSFTFGAAVTDGGPFNLINKNTAVTMTLTSAGTWTIGSAVTLTASTSYFTTADTGDYMLLIDPADVGQWAVVKLATYSTGTVFNCTVHSAFGLTGSPAVEQDGSVPTSLQAVATYRWAHSLLSSRYGYPGAVCLHDQRLIYGAFPGTRVQQFAGTTVGDFELFSYGINDDDHINYELATTKRGEIMWMTSFNNLFAGTYSHEYIIRGGGLGDPITPTNIAANANSANGSRRRMPEHAGDQIVFIQRSGRKLISLSYDEVSNKAVDTDLTILSEHLTYDQLLDQLAYAQEPDRVIWMTTQTGRLLGLTYDNKQNVAAWHRHDNAVYRSVAAIPAAGADTVYVIAEREVNGNTVRYVERMDFVDWRINNVPEHLDSMLVYSGPATTVIPNLTHLEGRTVRAWADGEDVGEYTVATGSITISKEASYVLVGLEFDSRIKELPDPIGSPDGTSVGRTRRKSPVKVRFYRTVAAKINGDVVEIPRENPSATKPELFTGTVDVTNLGWAIEEGNEIQSIGANPLTIQHIASIIAVGQE